MKCTCHIIEGPEEIVHQKCALCKAAPELLEACKAIEFSSRMGELLPNAMEMVRNAIAKAEER